MFNNYEIFQTGKIISFTFFFLATDYLRARSAFEDEIPA